MRAAQKVVHNSPLRLMCASSFSIVSFRFPRTNRLLSGAAFKRVFQAPIKSSDAYFTVLARTAACDTPARMGLAIARKQLKRAVDRNRIKRLVRETFRMQAPVPLDYVVMTRNTVRKLTNAELQASLIRHFQRIAAKS